MSKIAIITQDLVGQGVQYVAAITARMFACRGWEVDVLVSKVHVDLLEAGKTAFALPINAKIMVMPSRRGSRNGMYIRNYLHNGGSDIVICESDIYSWCVRWASLGLPRKKLPRLVQLNHGTGPEPKGFFPTISMYFKYWFHYSKFYAYMFVDKQAMLNAKRFMKFVPHVRLAVVNNPCIDEVFYEKIKLQPTHPWLVHKNWKTLVCAGAYESYKDHVTLIKAMRKVKELGYKIRVIIFGRGHLLETYRQLIHDYELSEYVSVGGYTDRLPAEIKASDGFVLSSNWESFGIVLVEALACGVPCISTDAPYGPREILDNGRYGRLLPIANSESMANAIIDLVNGKIEPAPAESWQRYTIDKIQEKYFETLQIQ